MGATWMKFISTSLMDSSGLFVDDTGMEKDMTGNTQGSNIITMEPFTSPTTDRTKKIPKGREQRNKRENMNMNKMMQILPGVYELVSFNKFLVLQFEDGKNENVNVFKGNREIMNCCGGQPKIRSQMDGSLLIEVISQEQSEKLMKMTELVGRKVSCIPHPTFNQCRGVVYAPELLSIDAGEIQSELHDQNVIRVLRMRKKVQGQLIPLPTLVLTFSTHKLPTTIKAGWLTLKVKPYIPSPLRCYHCQMYGHLIQKCKKLINQEPAVCHNCGKSAHGECKETPSCINCGGEHPASSKSCSKFLFEKEVQAIKVMEKLTFKEARKRALDRQINHGEIFSSVVRNMKQQQQQKQKTQTPKSPQNLDVNLKENEHQCDTPNVEEQQIFEAKKSISTEERSVRNKEHLKADLKASASTPKSKGCNQANSKNKKAVTPKKSNTNEHRKRTRTPDENLTECDEKDDELTSQKSIVIPRNAVKLKRLEKLKK